MTLGFRWSDLTGVLCARISFRTEMMGITIVTDTPSLLLVSFSCWTHVCLLILTLSSLCRLSSGLLNVQEVLKHEVKIGLGTG